MRTCTGAICLLVLAAAISPAAAQPSCARMPEPSVRLEFNRAAPEFATLPMAELQRMSRDGLGEHARALGLYGAKLRTSMQLRYAVAARGGQACLGLREAAIEVELAERRIYLARELRRGTCRYDVTLAHEQNHARIDDAVLGRELPKLKAAIAREAAENGVTGPIRERDVEAYSEEFGERLQRVFRREMERIDRIRSHEQSRIDTPEAYRREDERCPGGLE